MAYIRQVFVNGNILTAEELNHMDEGIYNNDSNISILQSSVSGLESTVSGIIVDLGNKMEKDLLAQQGTLAQFNSSGSVSGSSIPSEPSLLNTGSYLLRAVRDNNTINYDWANIVFSESNGNVVISW